MTADAIVPDWFSIVKYMNTGELIKFAKQVKRNMYTLSFKPQLYTVHMSRNPLSCGNMIIEL
jgi:hypothetical protein